MPSSNPHAALALGALGFTLGAASLALQLRGPQAVQVRSLELVDAAGQVQAQLAAEGGGVHLLLGAPGQAQLHLYAAAGAGLRVADAAGTPLVALDALPEVQSLRLGQAGSGAELLSGEDVALRLRAAGERGATLAVGPSQGAGLQLLDGPSREASLDAGPLGRAEGPDLVLRSGAAAQVWVPAPAAP